MFFWFSSLDIYEHIFSLLLFSFECLQLSDKVVLTSFCELIIVQLDSLLNRPRLKSVIIRPFKCFLASKWSRFQVQQILYGFNQAFIVNTKFSIFNSPWVYEKRKLLLLPGEGPEQRYCKRSPKPSSWFLFYFFSFSYLYISQYEFVTKIESLIPTAPEALLLWWSTEKVKKAPPNWRPARNKLIRAA